MLLDRVVVRDPPKHLGLRLLPESGTLSTECRSTGIAGSRRRRIQAAPPAPCGGSDPSSEAAGLRGSVLPLRVSRAPRAASGTSGCRREGRALLPAHTEPGQEREKPALQALLTARAARAVLRNGSRQLPVCTEGIQTVLRMPLAEQLPASRGTAPSSTGENPSFGSSNTATPHLRPQMRVKQSTEVAAVPSGAHRQQRSKRQQTAAAGGSPAAAAPSQAQGTRGSGRKERQHGSPGCWNRGAEGAAGAALLGGTGSQDSQNS